MSRGPIIIFDEPLARVVPPVRARIDFQLITAAPRQDGDGAEGRPGGSRRGRRSRVAGAAAMPGVFAGVGRTTLAIPWAQLAAMVSLAAEVGVLAALWPASRRPPARDRLRHLRLRHNMTARTGTDHRTSQLRPDRPKEECRSAPGLVIWANAPGSVPFVNLKGAPTS